MDENYITLEVEEEGCGRLQFELPLDITDEEVAYIKSLVPRAESGLLELLIPTQAKLSFAAPQCWCINQISHQRWGRPWQPSARRIAAHRARSFTQSVPRLASSKISRPIGARTAKM